MYAFGFILGAYLLITPALGLWALAIALRERRRIEMQGREILALHRQVTALTGEPGAAAPKPEQPHSDEGFVEVPQAEERPPQEQLEDVETPQPTEPKQAPPEGSTPSRSPLPQTPLRPVAQPSRLATFEQSLTSRWLVWLGAITIALAGTFLVKYSMDQGWLGPAVRVTLGLILGLILVASGEWLRRRPLARALAAVQPDYVPPALTAAGLSVAFASGYTAFVLYGLLGSLFAFALLAFIAAAAIGLAILQGPFIALLGLLGGYLTPLLVQTGPPAAWPLFSYLFVLTAGLVLLIRIEGWWKLGWMALSAAALWPFFWFVTAWSAADTLPLSFYIFGLAALFLSPRRDAGNAAPLGTPSWFAGLVAQDRLTWGAAAVLALLSFALLRMDSYGTISLVTLGLLSLAYLVLGRQLPVYDGWPVLAGLTSLVAIATWHLPQIITEKQALYRIAGRDFGSVPGPIVPPELSPFVTTSVLFGVLFGIAGFVALWGAKRPGVWATLSAAVPVSLLALDYWRITAFEIDLAWSAAALGLAGLALVACTAVERHRQAGYAPVLAAYAAAVIGAISLAATMSLEQAWLTVALALQLPALAWTHSHLKDRSLRLLGAVVAAIVLVRLALNPFILDYALGALPAVNWILYGYGIPALTFFVAARQFQRAGRGRLITLLDAGALIFSVLLLSLEIRTLVVGPLDSPEHPLLEQALQSLTWLILALGLYRIAATGGRPVALWGAHVLTALAAAQVLVLQVFVSNPLFGGALVPGPVGANVLVLAYAAPALLAFALARDYGRYESPKLAGAAGLVGLGLLALYISLEVRHAFQGANLAAYRLSDAELYSYSVVWLVYAGVLLAIALRSGSAALRYVSLGILLATTAKVFLIDLASLTDLYRVASFLGLGLSLVGIGYLYQRYVFPPRPGGSGVEPEQEHF